MKPEVAKFLKLHHVSEREAVARDVAPWIGTSLEERGRGISQACHAAAAIVEGSPYRERILAHREPPHPSYRGIMNRLRGSTAEPRG